MKIKGISAVVLALMIMTSSSATALAADTANVTDSVTTSDTVGETDASNSDIITDGNFTYRLRDDGTYEISCSEDKRAELAGELVIPAEYNGKSVSAIAMLGFANCSGITSVVIEEGITSLGYDAFSWCRLLSSVSIPASLAEMESNAFQGCDVLETVTIAEGNNSFCVEDGIIFTKDKTALVTYPSSKTQESYTIPEGVTKIYTNAFSENQSIRTLTVPEGVTVFGLIQNCWYMRTLDLPKSLETFEGIFGMDRLYEINFGGTRAEWDILTANVDDGSKETLAMVRINCAPDATDVATGLAFKLLNDGTYEVYCPAEDRESLTGELVVPAEYNGIAVTRVGSQGFSGCNNITSVVIENGITEIADLSFASCSSLETISIPASVERTSFSFAFNRNLKSFSVDAANSVYASVDGILFSKDKTRLELYPAARPETSYTIPDGVEVICDTSFGECPNLTEIVIPEGVKEIENHAFAHNNMLQSVNIPASVEKMGENNIFSGCENVQVTINEGNKSFIINDGVIFTSDVSELVAYLSSKSDEEYRVPESVRRIRGDAFSMNQHIKSLVLNEGLTQFSNIQNCWNLKSITIPKSVTKFEGISGMDSFSKIIYGGTIGEWLNIKSDPKLDPDGALGVCGRVMIICNDGGVPIEPEKTESGDGSIEFKPGVNGDDVVDMDIDTAEIVQYLLIVAPKTAGLDDAELYAKRDLDQQIITDGIAMDLKFIKNDLPVQPTEPVMITLPIPESLLNESEIYVYHLLDNQTVETIKPEIDREANLMTFNATHFSTYVFTNTEYKNTSSGDSSDVSDSGSNSSDSDNSGSASTSDTTSSETTSSNTSSESTNSQPVNSSDAPTSSDVSSNSAPTISNANPSTGIAVSSLPLLALLSAAVVVIKKRK